MLPPRPARPGFEAWTFTTAGRDTRVVCYQAVEDSVSDRPPATLILAPGAGAGQDHPGMVGLAAALAGHGLTVITFDFPHTAAGTRRPDPAPVVAQAWRDALASVRARVEAPSILFIGGRSMGGRIATELAASDAVVAAVVSGIVCFGYPLRPPYRASPRSLSHFGSIQAPILIVQGTRDTFGGPDDVRAAAPVTNVTIIGVEGADHGLTVPKRSGKSTTDVLDGVAGGVVSWMRQVRVNR